MLRKKNIFYIVFIASLLQSCTKLDEKFRGDLTDVQVGADTANTAALLQGVYNSMEDPFTSHLVIFPLQELSSDEAIAPTRGPDWDDNGVWRVLHQQKWPTNNERIRTCFNVLNGISYAATDLLRYHPTSQQQAETRFIRAWVMYLILDLFDQVPYRDPGESLVQAARVRKGIEALTYIINELKSIVADLPDGPKFKANKFAARVLLMKCYLNKAVYINRASPAFDAGDMNKTISLADTVINSNAFSFAQNYFDNFAPDNTAKGSENIFTLLNEAGTTPNNVMFLSYGISLHYNSFGTPWHFAGVNGWTTLSDFYDKFEQGDIRRGTVYTTAGSPPNQGSHVDAGFLIGQQYDLFFTIDSLTERDNPNPLFFTREVKNIELGKNLQSSGIRPVKYFPDFNNYFSPDNDFIFFRLADVLLMKAEAIFRGGTGTTAGQYGNTALSIVNSIRTNPSRGASALTSINADNLIDERGREMWWEGWRRQDLIRFGKFLQPWQEKEYTSDPKYLVFPIPDEQLAVNPNLIQNPGY